MSKDRGHRAGLPDFFIAGVPKAGTTALHTSLALHPQLLLSKVKEPKYFMCDGRPPRLQAGPGDAHSAKEWVWGRDRYLSLFTGPPELVRGESTPFYLYDPAAHLRIAAEVPGARFVLVLRDPVDRAYSNWLHLWSDGLEPLGSFEDACAAEPARIGSGWGLFWHYQRLGRYGEQLDHLLRLFPREQVLILRYRELVDTPVAALDRICGFLDVETGVLSSTTPENSRGFVLDSARNRALARVIRAGARVGSALPPAVWRRASRPLTSMLQEGTFSRPPLSPEVRRELVEQYRTDIALLERLTGQDFGDWLGDVGRGAFATRQAQRAE